MAAWAQVALAALILLVLAVIAWHFNARPRHAFLSALPDTVRGIAAAVAVFALEGFGLVRLLLPAQLRRYELLWVLPTGACALGVAMTVLAFAAVPYHVSLPLLLVAGGALSAYSVRRRGWPEVSLARLGWPTYLFLVVLAVALVPMVFVQHYAAPVGTGSDAHVAAGVGELLKHVYPTGVDYSAPINRMQPTWQSKYPIYYALAGVSSVSGLATWQVLATVAAVLLAMTAAGMFLVAREVFGTPWVVALVAMCIAALDRMALHTVLNPYFNQTWGYFAMPFTVVLGWWVVQPGLERRARQGTLLLLVLFAVVLVFAYPLAAPIPAVPLVVFAWSEHRRRIARGEGAFRVRDLYRGKRSLLWIIPLIALLIIPAVGVVQKASGAIQVVLPGHSLAGWGGDLPGFIPYSHFFSLPNSILGAVLLVVVLALALWGLWNQPRALAWGLGGLLVLGLLFALYFRQRRYGYYFEFKLLAFVGPLVLLIAAIGAGRIRRLALPLLAGFGILTTAAAVAEIKNTGYQLPQATIELSSWAKSLPKGASVRLDMRPPQQLWAAYFLDSQPLCSQQPLVGTDYPHVPVSRKADYIVATVTSGRPADAIGHHLRLNLGYWLWRENPAVPGPDRCSRERLDRLYTGSGHSRQ